MTIETIHTELPEYIKNGLRSTKTYYNFLRLNPNDVYKIKIEKPCDFKNSFFSGIYLNAFKATAEIITLSDENIKLHEKNKNRVILNQAQEYNNIIAFCGERGTGKTSAMVSFLQGLLNINEINTGIGLEKREINDTIIEKYVGLTKNHSYSTIEIIDPSLFEKGENIFEVVLAQMFSSFENELLKTNSKKNIEEKRTVLSLFEKVYENLQAIKKNGNYDGEALETLNKLSCGANLRHNFKELVREYLSFINNNSEKSILVIGIDDFDLNVKGAVDMAEQIRKYLMIPQVVVLLAVNMDQLEDVKEQAVRKDFELMLKTNQLKEDPKEITLRYLLKLIPGERRLLLPKVSANTKETCLRLLPTDSEERIKDLEEQLIKEPNNEKLKWKVKDKNIEEYILSLIYKKTGLIFTSKDYRNHFLVPTNLRKLIELVHFLVGLDGENQKKSFLIFREYLLSNYINEFFSPREMDLLNKLIEAPSFTRNKLLIIEVRNLLIDNYLQKYKQSDEPNNSRIFNIEWDQKFEEIVNPENSSVNISLRDVLFFLDKLQHTNYYKNKERFIDVVKVIYSIELYKYLVVYNNFNAVRELCGESVINTYSESLIRSSDSLKHSRNDFSFNLEAKYQDADIKSALKDIKNYPQLQAFVYCLTHFGSDYSKRRKEKESFGKTKIVLNNNLLNQKWSHYDLFGFVLSELNPTENITRFYNGIALDVSDFGIILKSIEHISSYYCSLPIYSIDLMQEIFSKNFSHVDFKEGDVETLFSAQVAILNEIKKRIRNLRIEYLDKDHLLNAFSDSPFVREFFNPSNGMEEIYSSISTEFSTIKDKPHDLEVINELKREVDKTDLTYGRFRTVKLEPMKYRLEKVLEYQILAKLLVKTKVFTDDRRVFIKDQIDFARKEFLRKNDI